MTTTATHLDDPQYELGLDCGLRNLDWLYLRKFFVDLERDFDQQRAYLAYLSTRWFTAYEMLKSYEDCVILEGKANTYEHTYFAACLAELRGKGLHLLNLVQQNTSLDLKAVVGFGPDDITAVIAELATSEGAAHRAMTEARKQELDAVLRAAN
jgi:hypothetical protein